MLDIFDDVPEWVLKTACGILLLYVLIAIWFLVPASAPPPKKEQVQKIDAFFEHRNMPLKGYGAKMVAEAEKNDIDWRLLPAIAVRESSGGKQACGDNPFGWGSCRIRFSDLDTAIETVAKNLGGNNPATHRYYHGTTEEKLYSYNGSVLPSYPDEVLKIMDAIEKEEVGASKDEGLGLRRAKNG